MKKNKVFFYIFVIIALATMSLLLTKKLIQNDTFYTIKVGESISKYGVDMKEHFSWLPNLSYTYPHWLYDLSMYFLYNIGGFTSLYISTVITGFILLYLMYYLTDKLVNNKPTAFILTFIFSFFLHGFFTARAQMISYIFLLSILYSIEMLRKTEKKRYYLYIFIFSLLIANIHLAVWPFIIVLFLPFIVQDFAYLIVKKYNIKFINKYNIEIEKSSLKITSIAMLICLLTGFMTPNFLVPFTYFINTYRGVSMKYINEHLPLTIKDRIEIYAMILVLVILLLNKNKKIKLRDLFMISGLFLLAFKSYRNVSLFFILSIFSFARLINLKSGIVEYIIYHKLFESILIAFFVICFCVQIKSNLTKPFYKESEYPVSASDYIIDNLDYKNIKLYNKYDYGSYLLYRGIPVFIDSRADLYLEEFTSSTAFIDNYSIFYNYEKVFSKYGVSHVLIKNGDKLNYVLKKDNNYKLIYSDDYFTLYEVLT